jgi:hypothetical protein
MDLNDLVFGEEEKKITAIPQHSWQYHIQQVSQELTKQITQQQESRRIRPRSVVSVDGALKLKTCSGDEIVRKVLATLDQFRLENGQPLTRSREQRLFHFLWLQAFLPNIYGVHWNGHSERVLSNVQQLFGFPFPLSRVYFEVLCLTPRRYGKTWAVAMFIAALIYCVPGVVFANFSTGKRASAWVMQDVMGFFSQLPNASKRIVKKTEEHLFISEFEMENTRAFTGRVAEFNSFPSSVDGKSQKAVARPFSL